MKYSAIAIASLCSGLLCAQTASTSPTGSGSWGGLLVAAGCQTSGSASSSNLPRTTASAEQKTSDLARNTADPYRNTTDLRRATASAEAASSAPADNLSRSTARPSSGTTSSGATETSRTSELSNRTTDLPSRTTDLSRASAELSRNSPSDQAGNTAMDRTTAGRSTADRGSVVQSADRPSSRRETPDAIARRTSPGADQEVTTRSDLGNSHPSHPDTGSADRMATPSSEDAMVVRSLDASCRITSSTQAYALRMDDGRIVRFDEASNAKIQQQLQSGDRLSHKSKIFRVKVNGSMQGDTIQATDVQI